MFLLALYDIKKYKSISHENLQILAIVPSIDSAICLRYDNNKI